MDEALSIADHVCLISGGKVIEQGSPQEITESTNLWTKQFIEGLPDGPLPFHYESEEIKKDLFKGFHR